MADDIPHRLRDRARHGASLLGSLVKAGAKRVIRRSDDDDRALGDALVRDLDTMKGMAMKVGQILSYLDAPLPEETVARLATLQQGVTPLSFDAIRTAVEAGLGAPLPELFDRFDETPVAAASIGQVHRAVLHGRDVAVKVQYPSVKDTFEADFRQLGHVARLASLATAVDGAALVAELQARLIEECDYAQEARWQTAFRAAWAGDPVLVIPEVVPERSAATVLTTAWLPGAAFDAFLQTADRDARDRAGLALARFAWRGLFELRTLHADPHPGNFLFAGDRVGVLDFGCVRRIPDRLARAWAATFRAVLDGRRADFEGAVRDSEMVGSARFDFDAHWELVAYSLRPYLTPGFRFTRDYTQEMRRFSGPSAPNQTRMKIPPEWIWFARLQFGLHAVLARLGAQGDFAGVFRDALDADPRPLSP